MDNIKIFVSIFCGAVLGGIAASSMDYFWIFSVLVGVTAGYLVRLAFEPSPVVNTARESCKDVEHNPKSLCSFVVAITGVFSTYLLYELPTSEYIEKLFSSSVFPESFADKGNTELYTVLIIFIGLAFTFVLSMQTLSSSSSYKTMLISLLFVNPVGIILSAIFMAAVFYLFLIAVIVFIAGKFFVMAHSDQLTLCAVWSAVGASMSYFYWNVSVEYVILSVVVAGILGVFHYNVAKVFLGRNATLRG